ncbi:zinc finger protein 883-like isoform X1 [Astyanax mexicanus]|uniref:Zinc finger protein 883-like isoform X1 n=1 Tax=Astyanax mexicanus TaxID=7994 RepID=A0A8T2L0P7_ASTMX|nr:zinc finger protein 883-like isoform X1 [Astyanax mexicanus]
MAKYEVFQSETALIMSLLTEAAHAEICTLFGCQADWPGERGDPRSAGETEADLRTVQLRAVLELQAKEAVRKICRLFKFCSVVKVSKAANPDSAFEALPIAGRLMFQQPRLAAGPSENAQTGESGVSATVSGNVQKKQVLSALPEKAPSKLAAIQVDQSFAAEDDDGAGFLEDDVENQTVEGASTAANAVNDQTQSAEQTNTQEEITSEDMQNQPLTPVRNVERSTHFRKL